MAPGALFQPAGEITSKGDCPRTASRSSAQTCLCPAISTENFRQKDGFAHIYHQSRNISRDWLPIHLQLLKELLSLH